MLELGKIYIKFMKREKKNIRICNVISRLVEKKKNLEEVGDIFIMEWNLL
jgi:predicted CopG family antitoxin